MASFDSRSEYDEQASNGVSKLPSSEVVQPPTKKSRTEIVLSVLLSAVFIGFCIYMLRENPLLGIALAILASIIGAIGWFVTRVFRWLRNFVRRKRA